MADPADPAAFKEFSKLVEKVEKQQRLFNKAIEQSNFNLQTLQEELTKDTGALNDFYNSLDENQKGIIKNANSIDGLASSYREYEEQAKAATSATDRLKKAFEEGTLAADSYLLSIGFGTSPALTGAIRAFKEETTLASGALVAMVRGLGQLTAAVSPLKALESFVGNTFSLVMRLDEIRASFVKLGPEFERFTTLTRTNRQEVLAFGGDIVQLQASFADLGTRFSAFTLLSANQQESLALLNVGFTNLGATASGITQTLMIGFNMTAAETEETILDLVAASESLGISVTQLESDFMATIGTLAMYGDQADEVFIKFEALSKTTGIAANQLLNFSTAFENIDQAATAVGRVNNLFGDTVLNMEELVEADAADRLEILRERILGVAGSFENIVNVHPQFARSLANIITGGDIGALQALLSDTADSADDLSRSALEASMTSEEFAERSRTSQASIERLKRAVQSLAIALQPLVDWMSRAVDGLSYGIAWLTGGSEAVAGFTDEAKKMSHVVGAILAGGLFLRWALAMGRLALASRIVARSAPAVGPALTSAAAGVSAFANPAAAMGLAVLVGIPALIMGISAALAARSFRNAAEMMGKFVDLFTMLGETGLSGLLNRVSIIRSMTLAVRDLGKAIREEYNFEGNEVTNFRAVTTGIKDLSEASATFSAGNVDELQETIRELSTNIQTMATPAGGAGGAARAEVRVYIGQEEIRNIVTRWIAAE